MQPEFDKSILDNYNCKFLILIPLLHFNSDPLLFYEDSRIRIIYFKSDHIGYATDIRFNREEWTKLQALINHTTLILNVETTIRPRHSRA